MVYASLEAAVRFWPDLAKRFDRGARLALALAFLCALAGPGRADDGYRLGPEDKIRLRVWEWRPASASSYQWEALNGEFTVDSAGLLSLPLIGPVHAAGTTATQLSDTIADRLKSTAELAKAPSAAVEVLEYRPFYILGAVERPNSYPYRPGLNVLQAVSLAGGLYRPEQDRDRYNREIVSIWGEIRAGERERINLQLRLDRLSTEAAGTTDTIAFSKDVTGATGDPNVARGIEVEEKLFETRKYSLASQIDLLTQANALLEDELKALAAKTETQTKQLGLARRELDNVKSLMNKGLVVTGQQVSVERNVAEIESSLLDLTLAAARTKQDISRNERAIADLRNTRGNEVLKDLRDTQMALDQIDEKLATARDLLHDSEVVAPREAMLIRRDTPRVIYYLIRPGTSDAETEVGENAPVQPGDIVKVDRVLPSVEQPKVGANEDADPSSLLAQR